METATKRWFVTAVALSIAFVAVDELLSHRTFLVHLWADAWWTLAALGAAIKCLQTSQRLKQRRLRLAWRWFAAGAFAWFLGMLVWDWQELVARVYAPFPSAGVLGFLALPVCMAVGFGLLRGEPDGAANVRLLLVDAGFFAFLMVLFNVVLLSGVLQSFTGTPLALASGLAYPVLHSSALALGIVVAGQARGRERTSLLLVVLSLAVLTGTVTVYAFSLLSRTYQVGAFLDVFWFAALLLLIGAAIEADALARHPAEPPAAQDARALVIEALLPAAALAIVALGAIMFSEQLGPALTWLLLSATIGVSVFYGLRLWQTRLAERASAEERARLFREAVSARAVAEAGQRREAFLAESSRRLGASLVLEETLPSVAGMAVPVLADWCAIAVLEVGRPPQVVCAHRDRGEQERIAEALADRLFFSPQTAGNLEKALLSGETQLVAAPEGAAQDELVARLAAQEVAFVPLRAHGATVGLLVLGLERGERRFDLDARTLAEVLGRRCALAIENARLFRRAQEAIAFRDEFLVVASHELRTPLTTLLLQLERLLRELDTAPSERQRRLLESGIAQVRRLSVLSERLVDTASIADGRFELRREPCDLARIATQVVAEFQEQAQRAGCELTLEASETRGEWDAERLSQVIRNLLSNALRYGAGRSVEVRVWTDGDTALLSVTDHGIGIAPADVGRIFERWERAASTRHFGGLGLGLYLSRFLVEAHGGHISMESTPNVATTFKVDLPLSTSASPAARA